MTASSALVTGGSGYFGSLLRDRLHRDGQVVRTFDLVDADDRPSGVDFLQGDIRDSQRVGVACARCQVIYHCVAQAVGAMGR